MSRDLMTVREAAEYLRASPNTVTIWCRAGKLPAIKIGGRWRVSKSAIERHIDLAATQLGLVSNFRQHGKLEDGSLPPFTSVMQNDELPGAPF